MAKRINKRQIARTIDALHRMDYPTRLVRTITYGTATGAAQTTIPVTPPREFTLPTMWEIEPARGVERMVTMGSPHGTVTVRSKPGSSTGAAPPRAPTLPQG